MEANRREADGAISDSLGVHASVDAERATWFSHRALATEDNVEHTMWMRRNTALGLISAALATGAWGCGSSGQNEGAATEASARAETEGQEVLSASKQRPAEDPQQMAVRKQLPAHEQSAKQAENPAKEELQQQPTGAAADHAAMALWSLPPDIATVQRDVRGVVITPAAAMFQSNQSELSPAARESMAKVADAVAQQPASTQIRVEGYTDSEGTEAGNDALSEKRAQSVADQLVAHGIDQQRIEIIGRGESNPVRDNATPTGRASNRHVDLTIHTAPSTE